MKKVLVAGASGYFGRYLVRALKEQGYWVRVLVRNSNVLNRFGSHGSPAIIDCIDEVFEGEVTKLETIEGVCDGIDIVFSSIGITRQKDGMSYKNVDYQGNLNLLGQAKSSKVTKFIYISVFKGNERIKKKYYRLS